MQSSCLILKASESWISYAGIIRFHTQAFSFLYRVVFFPSFFILLLSAVSMFAILKLRLRDLWATWSLYNGKKVIRVFVCLFVFFNCLVCLLPFQVFNARDLAEEMSKIQSVLSDDKNDWEHRVAAVRESLFWNCSIIETLQLMPAIKIWSYYFSKSQHVGVGAWAQILPSDTKWRKTWASKAHNLRCFYVTRIS